MAVEVSDWGREASLLRPARLTLALFASAPAVDPGRPWVPEHLVPLWGGRKFAQLTPMQRLRYNHAYARQLVSEFIWTERFLILGPLEQLCRTTDLDPSRSAVLKSFISDELHHVESFMRLEDLAIAADQPATKSPFCPPPLLRGLARIASRYPKRLTFWAAVIERFEQQTLKVCQEYHRDGHVDPLFRDVFVTHARDEARHCRLDGLIATWLRSEAGAAWNVVSDRLVSVFRAGYWSVSWGLDGPVRDLVRRYPELAPQADALIAESKALRRGASQLEPR